MGCLYQILLLPFQILLLIWNLALTVIKVIFELIIKIYLYCIKCIPELITDTSSSSTKKRNKKTTTKETQFDKESKLWGLSNEDKRIAKEERLSPADYIEAEERDNDDLIDDD